jgi:hypothetical protein
MAIQREYTKDERIKREIKRINSIFKDLDKTAWSAIDGLIKRAAYMRVTLEDYEKDLDKDGYIEMFTQSAQTAPYERERPVARLYNAMNKNYQSIMKQLVDAMPANAPPSESGEILKYASGQK